MMGTRDISYYIPLPVPLWGWPDSAIPIPGCRCGIGKTETQEAGEVGKLVGLGMNGEWEACSLGVQIIL